MLKKREKYAYLSPVLPEITRLEMRTKERTKGNDQSRVGKIKDTDILSISIFQHQTGKSMFWKLQNFK